MFRSLDESKVKGTHLRITALSSAGNFLDGFDISIISVAILLIPTVFNLESGSSIDSLLLIGSTLIGMIFGGIFGGWVTDRSGRKFIYLWDMVLFIVFTILTAISTSFFELVTFRMLLGVAIGADYAISPTIIAEYAPVKHRGKLLTISGISWFLGAAISYLAGYFLAPLGLESWRYMFLLGVIPAVIVLALRRSVPESPRWLAEKGRIEEAKKSTEYVVGVTDAQQAADSRKVGFRDLFGKKYIHATLFVLTFWFLLDAITYVIALQGPTILKIIGLTESSASGTAFIISLVAILGAVVTFIVIDRIGRKKVTELGFLFMFITLLIGGIALMHNAGILFIVVIFMMFEISEEFGPGITNSIYPQELFPTQIRATAQGLGTTVSRIGAVVGIFGFGALANYFGDDPYGYGTAMILLAVLSLAGLIVTLILGVETMGRSLEDLTSGK